MCILGDHNELVLMQKQWTDLLCGRKRDIADKIETTGVRVQNTERLGKEVRRNFGAIIVNTADRRRSQ